MDAAGIMGIGAVMDTADDTMDVTMDTAGITIRCRGWGMGIGTIWRLC